MFCPSYSALAPKHRNNGQHNFPQLSKYMHFKCKHSSVWWDRKKRLIKKQHIKPQRHCNISKGHFALMKCAMFKVNISSHWAAEALALLCSRVSAQFHFWAKESLCLGWNQFWRNKMGRISSVTWSASYKEKEHVWFPENQRSLRHLQNLGNLHDFFPDMLEFNFYNSHTFYALWLKSSRFKLLKKM